MLFDIPILQYCDLLKFLLSQFLNSQNILFDASQHSHYYLLTTAENPNAAFARRLATVPVSLSLFLFLHKLVGIFPEHTGTRTGCRATNGRRRVRAEEEREREIGRRGERRLNGEISRETEGAGKNEFGVLAGQREREREAEQACRTPGNRIARDYDYPWRRKGVIYPVARPHYGSRSHNPTWCVCHTLMHALRA